MTNKNIIINNLCGIYSNSVADGSWSNMSSADSKIIVLTTQVTADVAEWLDWRLK